jgi:hypothetical protein
MPGAADADEVQPPAAHAAAGRQRGVPARGIAPQATASFAASRTGTAACDGRIDRVAREVFGFDALRPGSARRSNPCSRAATRSP